MRIIVERVRIDRLLSGTYIKTCEPNRSDVSIQHGIHTVGQNYVDPGMRRLGEAPLSVARLGIRP
jgi:hypothetical protein